MLIMCKKNTPIYKYTRIRKNKERKRNRKVNSQYKNEKKINR